MEQARKFRIRRSILVPLGLLLFLLLSLMAICVAQGQPMGKVVILGIMVVPVLGLFLESVFRRVSIDASGVRVDKLFRRAAIDFGDVTAFETVAVRKRVFLTLCAGDDFLIISNSYDRFPELVRLLLAGVPADVVSEETLKMAEKPPRKDSDVISCWLAVLLVLFILYAQLFGRSV